MVNLSITQIIDLWCALEDARRGEGWGGSVEEIYAYRCGTQSPLYDPAAESGSVAHERTVEDGLRAACSLLAVCRAFEQKHGVEIYAGWGRPSGNWRRIGDWFAAEPFFYRVHLEVRRTAA